MRWIALALPLLALNACIYYENTGECESCQWDDWDDLDDDDNDPNDDDPNDVLDLSLYLTPDQAELGDMLIGSLKSADGADLSTVTHIEFFAAVNVHAFEARAEEVILSLGISAEAEPGPVGLLIEFEDGSLAEEDVVLTLLVPENPPEDDDDPCDE